MSRNSRYLPVVACILLVALSGLSVAPAARAAGASLHVYPATVSIGHRVTIAASNLAPGQFYTLMLVVPSLKHPVDRGFLSLLLRANAKGQAGGTANLPVLTHCGAATIYAYSAKTNQTVAAPIRLTGCRAGRGSVAPPPPPGGKKVSKGKSKGKSKKKP